METISNIYSYLALVMLVGFILGFLLKRKGLSASIGYLLAGVLIGLVINISHDVAVFMSSIGELALVLLFFEIGFEIHIERAKDLISFPLYVSLLEVFIAMSISLGIGLLLGLSIIESVFLGLAASFSSTIFTFKILDDFPPSRDDVKKMVLMVAAVEDIIIVITLSLIEYSSTDFTLINVVELIVYPLLLFAFAYEFAKHVLDRVLPSDENGLLLIIGYGLAFAYISSLVGLSPAIGAFIAGLASSDLEKTHNLMTYFKPIRAFTVFLFFVGMGSSFVSAKISLGDALMGAFVGVFLAFIHSFATIFASVFVSGLGFMYGLETGFYLSTLSELGLILIYAGFGKGLVSSWFFIAVAAGIVIASTISSYLCSNRMKIAVKTYKILPRKIIHRIESLMYTVYTAVTSDVHGVATRLLHTILISIGEVLLLTTIIVYAISILIEHFSYPLLVFAIIIPLYFLLYIRLIRNAIKAANKIIELIYGKDVTLETLAEKAIIAITVELTILATTLIVVLKYLDSVRNILGVHASHILATILLFTPILTLAMVELWIKRNTS